MQSIKEDTIKLSSLLSIGDLSDFKVHFARWNGKAQPLDVLSRSMDEWKAWQEYYPNRNSFNRPYVFSIAQDYRKTGRWLFGGIWKVHGIKNKAYEVSLSPIGKELIKRLLICSDYNGRTTRANLENHFDTFVVDQILPTSFVGRLFPGFDEVELGFAELEVIFRNNREDWRTALSNTKGIYLLSDIHTGKQYVGAAYGSEGVWSRWAEYIQTGHGGNAELRAIFASNEIDYFRTNFRFALLEAINSNAPDNSVIERELFWKRVLDSRGVLGLNRN
jgi:hypothetical protein